LLVSLEDGRTGIIREREIAWEREALRGWRNRFKPGDRLQALILDTDQDGRLELSLRLVQNDPWLDLTERYQPGQLVDGVVTGVQTYGVFIEIEPGVTGLLHRSRIPSWVREDPDEVFWPGDHVRVVVDEIDTSRRRLSLNLSKAWAHRWAIVDVPLTGSPASETPDRSSHVVSSNAAVRLPLEWLLGQRKAWSILVVEDDTAQCQAIAQWLQRAGQHVTTASTAEDALALLRDEPPDLALVDLGLPGMNGIQAMRQIRDRWPSVHGVIMTDWARADEYMHELDVLQAEGVSLLIKPLLPEDLLSVLFRTMEKGTRRWATEPPSEEWIAAADVPRTLTSSQESFGELLDRLRQLTRASKVILFALDAAQRRVQVAAERGHGQLREEAIVDLIYSPVRDVAEDRVTIHIADVRLVEARMRYLKPLLSFRSCVGVPVPGELSKQYALFLFHHRPDAFSKVHREYARAGAIALGALLEHQQFQERAIELQRLALLGHLSRALVHEINHQLGPIGFALESLEEQCARIERYIGDVPDALEQEVRQARDMLRDLTQGVRRLIGTARLFGQVTLHGHDQILRLDTLVAEAIELVRDFADRNRVVLEVEPPPKLLFTRAQAAQVQQVLLNVLLNAVQQIASLRPREGGRVRIRLDQQQRGDQMVLQVMVEDDGPGIHRRLWERIFELGFTTREEEGSGLGLYITRSLVEALGGRVYVVESHILWGTTFAIELPFKL